MLKFVLTLLTIVGVSTLCGGKDVSARTIHVPHDKKTIQAAMDYARSGDTILLAPGKYKEAVTFKSGVTLSGTDRRRCIITPVPGAAAVISAFNCKSGTIKNISINGMGKKNKKLFSLGISWDKEACDYIIKDICANSPASRAKLPLGAKFISINDFTSFESLFYVLAQGGKSSKVKLVLLIAGKEKTFFLKTQAFERQASWLSGIFLLNSSINITNCIIRNCLGDCNSAGIIVSGNGTSKITNNICYKNQYGIIFTNGAKGTVLKNICQKNNYSGIAFVQKSSGIMKNNIADKNKASGIFIYGEGTRVTINENVCTENSSQGISLASGASATIISNKCRQNQGTGIALASGAKALISNNKCNKNNFMGIWLVDEGTRAKIIKNTCSENSSNGIALDYEATGTIENNTCEKNKIAGIYIASKKKRSQTYICKGNYSEMALDSRESRIAEDDLCSQNRHYAIAKSVPMEKPIIRVPADKETIQIAMNSAKAGEIILVAPGKYKENITFKSGVTLAGEDKKTCIIIPVHGASTIISALNCKSGTIKNITIDGTGKEDKHFFSLGMLRGKKAFGKVIKSLFDYLITIHTDAPIDTEFLNGDPALDSLLYLLKQRKGKKQVKAVKKTLKHRVNGIVLRNSSINIDNCIIRNCINDRTGGGIIVRGKGKSNITNNVCYNNQFGIIFIEGAHGTVRNNTCNSNNYSGIAFASKSSGTITDNICNRNKASGIFISGKKTRVKINKNVCLENTDQGISFVYGATGAINNNKCNENNFVGIFIVGEKTSSSVINNKCNKNTYGIYRYKDSKTVIDKNKNSARNNSKRNFLLN